MKKCVVLFFNVLFLFALNAQNPNLTVSSLVGTNVDSILKHHLEGNGVLLSNGKFNNQTGNVTYPQIGTFNRNDFTDFPFATGLVLTTGNVSVAAGPNNSGAASSSVGNHYTESDLSPCSGGYSLTSCASLEFDFIAMADTFAVNYIFASEEYCEYVGSSFVDPFAFLLTGVDPVTFVVSTKNVSIVPGSITASNPAGDYVTVDLNGFSEEVYDITLVDISGKILRVIKPTENPMRIELTGLPSGTYGILVNTPKGHTTRFFVKK